jgi:peptidoglycan/LPS O-acetylase OafA/YrhL
MTNTRVNEIDLLRFCAALAVVFFHYAFRGYAADGLSSMPYLRLAPVAKYGYLGVELFFMISGFVILMTAANGNLRGFTISRITRLYPAFWVCCTITYLVTVAIGKPVFKASFDQYLINLTMLSEFFDVSSIDGAYWSLFVEIKFYVLVAIILLLGKIHRSQLLLIVWLVTSISIEFLPTFGFLPIGKLRYWLIVDYSALFIAGAVFYLIWSQGLSRTRLAIILSSWCLAIFQAIKGLPEFEARYNTSMNRYVVAGIITIFYIIMLLVSLRRTGVLGQKRWLLVGALTYPLYLLHENIGFMIFNLAFPAINHHLLFWGTIALILVAAFAVHILIEKRFSSLLKSGLNDLADRTLRLTRRFSETNP